MKTRAISLTLLLVALTVVVPAPANAAADTCSYPPQQPPMPPTFNGGVVVTGPYPHAITPGACAGGLDKFTSASDPCPDSVVDAGYDGQYCGKYYPAMQQVHCIVTPLVNVHVWGLVAGFDTTGPDPSPLGIMTLLGMHPPPDGNIDAADTPFHGTAAGVLASWVPPASLPPPGASFTVAPYPHTAPHPARLIAYPLAQQLDPRGPPAQVTVECRP